MSDIGPNTNPMRAPGGHRAGFTKTRSDSGAAPLGDGSHVVDAEVRRGLQRLRDVNGVALLEPIPSLSGVVVEGEDGLNDGGQAAG